MKTAIIIAAHKPYWMPQNGAYIPLLVGAIGKETPAENWQRDDSGDNISTRNNTFCELTGHYWLWKNVEADVYGLCHYRRYFTSYALSRNLRKCILNHAAIDALMAKNDVIVPKKRHYWIETNASQYAHAHHAEDLETTRKVIEQQCHEYLPDWDWMLQKRSGHRFNMFLMRKSAFEAYSSWLFGILFELEKQLDISTYSAYDRRVFGFLAERLLDVWLHHQRLKVKECPVVHLESQHWGKKIFHYLKRKFCAKRNV